MFNRYESKALFLDRCPHCNVPNPNLSQISEFLGESAAKNRRYRWKAYLCSTCGFPVVGGGTRNREEIDYIFPKPETLESGLPSRAHAYLTQAINCLHAPSGAIMLCASAVDEMLKQKELTAGSLYKRIKEAAEQHLITSDMESWAHEVRLDANEERHADVNADLPSTGDAKRCIDFTKALADFMFVLPAKVEEGRRNTSMNK
ncbi:MAG: DUF4145 domain-containing protein [Puniceicoccales bacterium]